MSEKMSDTKMTVEVRGQEVVMTRTFDAPRETVFHAFTNSEDLKAWWGPRGWTLPVSRMDFRENGTWEYCMQASTGEKSCGKSVFQKIDAPNGYTYSDYFSDEDGHIMEDMPEMNISMTFESVEEGTKVTSVTTFNTSDDLKAVMDMGAEEGMRETWDRLESYLARRPR